MRDFGKNQNFTTLYITTNRLSTWILNSVNSLAVEFPNKFIGSPDPDNPIEKQKGFHRVMGKSGPEPMGKHGLCIKKGDCAGDSWSLTVHPTCVEGA